MKSLWARYGRLSGRERSDLLWGILLLPVVTLRLRFFPPPILPLARGLSREGLRNAPQPVDAASVSEALATARMMDAASRHGLVRGNCLAKSVALHWLLRRRGLPVQLRLGARRDGQCFAAHAWVELAGQVINDPEKVRDGYVAFRSRGQGEVTARQ